MSLFKSKKGVADISSKVRDWIIAFVLIIVLFLVAAELLPEGQAAGNAMNDTGIALTSLLASDGVLWILFVVGLFLLGLFVALRGMGGKGK